MQHFRRAHIEGTRRVHPAEGKDSGQAIGVEHAGDQEAHDVLVLANLGDGLLQLPEPGAGGGGNSQAGGWAVGNKDKGRQGKYQIPHRYQHKRGTHVLGAVPIEVEQVGIGFDKAIQRHDKAQHAAGVTQPPGPA